MKNSTKIFSGLFALALVAVSVTSVSAYQGDPSVQGLNYSAERHEEMTQAFATNDYESWKELMNGKGRVSEVVNAENFAQFAEAHKLAEEGNIEASQAIRTELGLGLKNGSGQGQRGNNKGARSGLKDGTGVRGGTTDCLYNS